MNKYEEWLEEFDERVRDYAEGIIKEESDQLSDKEKAFFDRIFPPGEKQEWEQLRQMYRLARNQNAKRVSDE